LTAYRAERFAFASIVRVAALDGQAKLAQCADEFRPKFIAPLRRAIEPRATEQKATREPPGRPFSGVQLLLDN